MLQAVSGGKVYIYIHASVYLTVGYWGAILDSASDERVATPKFLLKCQAGWFMLVV